MQQIIININEWMLAAGSIEIRKELHRLNDMVLADGGPPLNPAQREYLRQLGTTPLIRKSMVVRGWLPTRDQEGVENTERTQ